MNTRECKTCPQCGAAVTASAPHGLCPKCLVRMAVGEMRAPTIPTIVGPVSDKPCVRIGRYCLRNSNIERRTSNHHDFDVRWRDW